MRVQLGVCVTLLVGIAVSCANGNTDGSTTDEGSIASGADSGTGSNARDAAPANVEASVPLTCTSTCSSGLVCSGGQCVADTTDADKDGHDVRTDCNDHDAAIHPGATEICNGIDDNCDGKIDEGFDADGDTYFQCPHGPLALDCDDTNAAIHPGVIETCNDVDDNCDGKIDEGFDVDNDTYFQCAHGALALDCNDTDPSMHPGAVELCDGKDNDCNGKIDDLAALIPPTGTDTFQAPVNNHWVASGSAVINTAMTGWTMLTPDSGGQAGALWWNASYLFDHFDVTFSFMIDAKSGGADGLGFTWVPGTTINVGGGGGGFGFQGLGGWGVVIDTYQNDGEPAVPFLAVMDTNKSVLQRSSVIPNVRDAKSHTMRVVLQSPNVSAWVDGVQYLSSFPIPSYVPFTGHWGFSAGTGSASERHFVTGISMSFPDGQGCVP